jgi:hypothetical protein
MPWNPSHSHGETKITSGTGDLANADATTKKALKSLEVDSRWIKGLTFVLVGLTIVLAFYAFRLDTVIHSLQSNAPPTPSPTATATP